eukprot:CAMPEP_0171416456 /NCGR_PEP_ID=MMETSP0880-20121228/40104_1 /TAXON_ID=67004 /ORGANISM="Thalassiosira weissflogii, Strain CCMP1336" /LENGTH=99 /DNA_ID=CAMNT_0011934703 /DNA_START=1110 /DNA_END=1407 /DNA_ORIENTATION=-
MTLHDLTEGMNETWLPREEAPQQEEGVYEGGSGRVGGSTARGKAWMKLISPATTLHNTTEGVNENRLRCLHAREAPRHKGRQHARDRACMREELELSSP